MGDHHTNDTDLARLRAATVVTTTPTLAVGTEVLAQMCNEVLELRQEIIDLGNINQDLEGTLHDIEQARDAFESMWNGEAQLANRLGTERDEARQELEGVTAERDQLRARWAQAIAERDTAEKERDSWRTVAQAMEATRDRIRDERDRYRDVIEAARHWRDWHNKPVTRSIDESRQRTAARDALIAAIDALTEETP